MNEGSVAVPQSRGRKVLRRTRVLAVAMVVSFGLFAYHVSTPSPASALSCGAEGRKFAGNLATHSDAVRGAKVSIEYFDPALCTDAGADTFSSYWVGVVGPYVYGRNILQVGVDECKNGACVNGSPENQTYKFWAYGREAGQCGALVDPEPFPIGNIASGDLTYKVIREQSGGQWYYNLYISTTGVVLWTYSESALDSCWGSVDEAQYMNEAWDAGTQIGGQAGNTQTFQSVYWYTGSSWTRVTGSAGAWCDAHDGASTYCKWHSTDNTLWNVWDSGY